MNEHVNTPIPATPEQGEKATKPAEAVVEQSAPVSLNRDRPLASDYRYQEENYYRMLGVTGYEDFKASNVIRTAQDTRKGLYRGVYYNQGFPLQRYASQQDPDHDYFVEVANAGDVIRHETEAGTDYPHSERDITTDDDMKIVRLDRKTGETTVVYDAAAERERQAQAQRLDAARTGLDQIN